MKLTAIIALTVITIATTTAIFAPWLAPYPYDQQDMTAILQSPNTSHILGTDNLGRDLLSRLIYGARVSLSIGLLTSVVALAVGTLYGAISGFKGGWIDHTLMRIVDVLYAIPDLLLIILITVVIGRGVWGIFIALSLVSWVSVARLVRGEGRRIKELAYIDAAKAVGANKRRIILRHLLPRLSGLLIVTMTFQIGRASCR